MKRPIRLGLARCWLGGRDRAGLQADHSHVLPDRPGQQRVELLQGLDVRLVRLERVRDVKKPGPVEVVRVVGPAAGGLPLAAGPGLAVAEGGLQPAQAVAAHGAPDHADAVGAQRGELAVHIGGVVGLQVGVRVGRGGGGGDVRCQARDAPLVHRCIAAAGLTSSTHPPSRGESNSVAQLKAFGPWREGSAPNALT